MGGWFTVSNGLAALAALGIAHGASAEDRPVAGVQPDQRPWHAPTINFMDKDPAWYAEALSGVERPYPRSLHFLDNQGNWYTPFSRPGMTGPYDMRGWHQQHVGDGS